MKQCLKRLNLVRANVQTLYISLSEFRVSYTSLVPYTSLNLHLSDICMSKCVDFIVVCRCCLRRTGTRWSCSGQYRQRRSPTARNPAAASATFWGASCLSDRFLDQTTPKPFSIVLCTTMQSETLAMFSAWAWNLRRERVHIVWLSD